MNNNKNGHKNTTVTKNNKANIKQSLNMKTNG